LSFRQDVGVAARFTIDTVAAICCTVLGRSGTVAVRVLAAVVARRGEAVGRTIAVAVRASLRNGTCT
jgi:hypothetical protein